MSSPLAVKRRRLNDASHTLAKPFVSPMRSSKPDRTPLKESSNIGNIPYTPSTLAHTINASQITLSYPISLKKSTSAASNPTPHRKPPTFTRTSSKRKDPAEVAAQRALTTLELQVRSLRNDLDTLTQAHSLVSSTTDAELEVVTAKWRTASQQAAEELFGVVKERVCRMGGVVAWREGEKKKHDRSMGVGEFKEEEPEDDDADCEFDSQGEELPEEEVEYRKSEKRRVRQEAMDAADVGDEKEELGGMGGDGKPKVWQEEGKDDDVSRVDPCIGRLEVGADDTVDFHDGHDAPLAQHRTRCHRVRQAWAEMGVDMPATQHWRLHLLRFHGPAFCF